MADLETTTEENTKGHAARRTLEGVVTSDKMNKTVVVMVTHRVRSQQYKKYMTKRVKYKAHSENNDEAGPPVHRSAAGLCAT